MSGIERILSNYEQCTPIINTEKDKIKDVRPFALYSKSSTLARRFVAETIPGMEQHYNVAPSQNIPIVREEGGRRHFALVRWGLVPHWAKDIKIGYSTINARAETVAGKPAFRNAFRNRRCLIPADGYYEWQVKPDSKIKQPWFIVLRNREPMAFAGLWERWRSPEGHELESCTIIVTGANAVMLPIHDRMPVILGYFRVRRLGCLAAIRSQRCGSPSKLIETLSAGSHGSLAGEHEGQQSTIRFGGVY